MDEAGRVDETDRYVRARASEHRIYTELGPPEIMARAHWHSRIELNLLAQGEMTYLINGRLVRLPEQHVGVFWAATPHQVIDATPRGRIAVVYLPLLDFLRLSLPEDFRRFIMRGSFLISGQPDRIDGAMFERWHRNLAGSDPHYRGLVLEEVLLRLKRMALEPYDLLLDRRPVVPQGLLLNQASLEHVSRMAEYIATEFVRPMKVSEIAAVAGLNPNYAMNVFRKVIGVTIGEYLTRRRLSHAQAMLLDTDAKVATVALDSGFGSVSRFYAVFNQSLGKTPSQYRAEFAVPRAA